MTVNHARAGANSPAYLARKNCLQQDRESIENAYPGDVIGLNNPGRICYWGYYLQWAKELEYEGIPCFPQKYLLVCCNP